jgi:hypothetical protein
MKKIIIGLSCIFNLFFVWYLSTPLPVVKDLTNAVKSDLPGDTTQLKNVTGYFTNLSRTEVINFYKANYNSLFRIQLNYPPEKAKEIFRDTTQTYYLEEFVIPLKGSIFINGYDWQNDVFTKPDKKITNKLIYRGVEYQSKITIKIYPTTQSQRLFTFFATEFIIFIIFILYKKFLKELND